MQLRLVCIHGSLQGPEMWAPLAASLAAPNRRIGMDCIRLTRMGYETDSPGPVASLRDDIEQVRDALDSATTPAIVFGSSYGAVVAMELAMEPIEGLAALVVHEPALPRGPAAERVQEAMEISADAGLVAFLQYLGIRDLDRGSITLARYAKRLQREFLDVRRDERRASFRGELPILAIYGDQTPPDLLSGHRFLMSQWQGPIETRRISGGDHLLIQRHPHEVADAVEPFAARFGGGGIPATE